MTKPITTLTIIALSASTAFGALDSAARYKNIANIGDITITGKYPASITNGAPLYREHAAWISEASAEMEQCVSFYGSSKPSVAENITADIFTLNTFKISDLHLRFAPHVNPGDVYFTSNAMPRYINLKLRYHAESIYPSTSNITDNIDGIIDSEYPVLENPLPMLPTGGGKLNANNMRGVAIALNKIGEYDVFAYMGYRKSAKFIDWNLLDDNDYNTYGRVKSIMQTKYGGTWNTVEEYTSHIGSCGTFSTTIPTNTPDYGVSPIAFYGYAVISSWAIKSGSHLGTIIDNKSVDVYTMPIIINVPSVGIAAISPDAYISSLVSVAGTVSTAEVSDPENVQTKEYFTKIQFQIHGVRYATNSGDGNY